MIYLVEDGNTYTMEQAEYPVTQLWSDIGGAAGDVQQSKRWKNKIVGLMLGISFATLIGVVDCLCSFLFVLIAKGTQEQFLVLIKYTAG